MSTQAADRHAIAATIETIASLGPLDAVAMEAAAAHLDRLTKPPGSLGRLEELVIGLAGITGRPNAPVGRRWIVVAAGDHGVAREGVSAYPTDVTGQMVANFIAGGAAINVLAAAAGASLVVVDVGVATQIPGAGRPGPDHGRGGRLLCERIADGTASMTLGPAMQRTDALRAVAVGLRIVADLRSDGGVDVLGLGEMGIGNTTSASAIVAALTGAAASRVTGTGTGIDDDRRAHKIAVIEHALEVNRPDPSDPLGVLAAVGGLEIAALVGLMLGAAAARIPVVLDGFITAAAALVAATLQPALAPRLIASHRSTEPGHTLVLERLGLRPYLDLGMRLGEGSGAALLLGLVDSACRIRDEMATFESAAVSGPSDG
jgi:nicotinate-nucleotide--dimethylbenzimidazole phosphoribosyltransferase